jgi:hypothetical protein
VADYTNEANAAEAAQNAQANYYRQAEMRERARRRARRTVDAEESDGLVVPEHITLDKLLAQPDDQIQHRIWGWWRVNGRVILAAARKTGKTTLVANVVQALVDTGGLWLPNGPNGSQQFNWSNMFLNFSPVWPLPQDGTVVVIDNEMNPSMLRRWYRNIGVTNPDRVVLWTLRGQGRVFDIVNPHVRAMWAQRLREVRCAVLILDCLTPALGALGLTESNEDVNQFLIAFDALLLEAGVPEALIAHHMGHLEERSRGASRLRDWPEVEWRYLRERDDNGREVDSGMRFLAAYGRDVDVHETRLDFDPVNRRLTLVGGSRTQHALAKWFPAVVKLVTDEPGIQTNQLKERLKDVTGVANAAKLGRIINAAGQAGSISIQRCGPGKPSYHFPPTPGGVAMSPVPPVPGDSK